MNNGTKNIGGKYYLLGQRFHNVFQGDNLTQADIDQCAANLSGKWVDVKVQRRKYSKGSVFSVVNIWVFGRRD